MLSYKKVVKSFIKKKVTKIIFSFLFSWAGLFFAFSMIILTLIAGIISIIQIPPSPHPTKGLPPAVEAYHSEMSAVAFQYEMQDYVDLLLAIMAAESGGDGLDPMQSSECGYNQKYPRIPNGITDTHYSLECRVQHFRDAKNGAGVENNQDMIHIKVAVQGYNFGLGYVPEAINTVGCWEQEHVYSFAQKHSGGKQRDPSSKIYAYAGPWSYGDQHYPDHVLIYYSSGDIGDEQFQKLKQEMDKHIGKPYDFGASGPDKFDCSGFVCYVFTTSGVKNIPRTTAQGLHDQWCTEIPQSDIKPGDLVFFTGTYLTSNAVSHVGVYIGNNQMIDANSKGVSYSDLTNSYWQSHLYSYGRLD